LPSQLFGRIRSAVEAIQLPEGYSFAWGGEHEDSRDAQAALARPLPVVLAIMVFIVVCLYNSIRTTLLIWLVMPLGIIGVTVGLLLTGMPFGCHRAPQIRPPLSAPKLGRGLDVHCRAFGAAATLR
jgi:multidrug efflux pump subunit AcrB